MDYLKKLFLFLTIVALFTGGITAPAFADEYNGKEPKTLEQVCEKKIDKKKQNLDALFCEAILTLRDLVLGLQQDTSTLQSQIDANDAEIATLQSQSADLQSQIDANDAEIATLQSQSADLQSQIDANDEDIVDLQAQIDANDTDLRNLQSLVRSLQDQINSNNADILTLQSQIDANDAEIADLKAKSTANMMAIQELDLATQLLQAQINSNNANIISLQSQISSNDDELSTLFDEVDSLQAQIDANDGDIVDLQAQLDAKMADIILLQQQTAELLNQISSNDEDIVDLQSQINENDADNTRLQGEVDTIQTEVVALQLRDGELQTQLDANDADNTRLQGEVDTIQTEIVALRLQGDSLQIQINTNNSLISDLELNNLALERQILQLLGDVKELQEQDRFIINSIDSLSARVDSFFTSLQTQISSNDQDIADLQEKTSDNMMAIQDIDVSGLERRVELLESAISTLNISPTVSAGSDRSLRFVTSQSTSLDGSASDDGVLLSLESSWSVVDCQPISGQPACTLDDAVLADSTSLVTDVTFSQVGIYVFRLIVTDGLAEVIDEVTISVFPNTTPVVDAGVPFSFTDLGHTYGDGRVLLSASHASAYLLRGSVNDPDGQPVTVAWSLDSGPAGATVTFTPVDSTSSSFSVSQTGDYVFRLTADDGLESVFDTISFTVLDDHAPPTVTFELSADRGPNATFLGRTGPLCDDYGFRAVDDGPNPATILWRVASMDLGYWYTEYDDGNAIRGGPFTSDAVPDLILHGTDFNRPFSITYTTIATDGWYTVIEPVPVLSCFLGPDE